MPVFIFDLDALYDKAGMYTVRECVSLSNLKRLFKLIYKCCDSLEQQSKP